MIAKRKSGDDIRIGNSSLRILEFILGILEFSVSLRGSKATEAISGNSRLGILV